MSFDTPEESLAFARKFSFQYPLIPDTDRKIGLLYRAADSPRDFAKRIAYVIDEEGVIVESHPKVNATTYPREQLERLLARG